MLHTKVTTTHNLNVKHVEVLILLLYLYSHSPLHYNCHSNYTFTKKYDVFNVQFKLCTVTVMCVFCASEYNKSISSCQTLNLVCCLTSSVSEVLLWFPVTDIKVSVSTVERLLPWFLLYQPLHFHGKGNRAEEWGNTEKEMWETNTGNR